MKHTDVARVWRQPEVMSNRPVVRGVHNEHRAADLGTKALGKPITLKLRQSAEAPSNYRSTNSPRKHGPTLNKSLP